MLLTETKYGEAGLQLKLTDFGCEKLHQNMEQQLVQHKGRQRVQIASLLFQAPELLLSLMPGSATATADRIDMTKIDQYSFALLLCWLWTGKKPFGHLLEDETDETHLLSRLRAVVCREQRRPDLPQAAPAPLIDVVRACWDHNPQARPQFSVILQRGVLSDPSLKMASSQRGINEAANTARKCGKCGVVMGEGEIFCSECGTRSFGMEIDSDTAATDRYGGHTTVATPIAAMSQSTEFAGKVAPGAPGTIMFHAEIQLQHVKYAEAKDRNRRHYDAITCALPEVCRQARNKQDQDPNNSDNTFHEPPAHEIEQVQQYVLAQLTDLQRHIDQEHFTIFK